MGKMIPGLNPRQMEKALKRMGINQKEIDAREVIIKTDKKDIIIKNPHVLKINLMGQETFQISGEVVESAIKEEDIETVAQQANVPKEEARKALERTNGDLAKAILELTEKSSNE